MKYRFLIYISYSYAVPIGNPLEKELQKRGYQVKWFADLDEGKKGLSSKKNVLNSTAEVDAFNPHVVLTASDSVPDFFPGLKVQVFHGFNAQKRPSAKNAFSHFRIRGFFDLYCTQGPSTTKGFESQAKKYPHFQVVETGWSKVDPLFPIKQKAKGEVPVVMIASTFTERLSLAHNNDVYKEIKRLSLTGEFKFISVLHPKMPKKVVEKWKALNNDNFTFYDTTDLIPLFRKADIMFADTTSAIQEFLLQKKPVVTFNHTFNHDYLIHANEANKIETAFKEALTKPSQLIKNIEAFILELHPYFDGQSSARIINACIESLHSVKNELKNKPLNLLRKYKMRKRLNSYSFKSFNKPFMIPKGTEKISSLIITYNEEDRIESLIENLSFTDEVVIVDSFSTDRTVEYVKKYKHVKLIQHPFENFSKQRNFALEQVENDWILFIDADERLSNKLIEEVKSTVKSPKAVAYEMYRKFYFKNKPLHFSGWQTDKVFRLINKNYVYFEPTKFVHETLNIEGKTAILKNKLIHYSYENYDDYKSKMNQYAVLRAKELYAKNLKPNFFHFYIKPLYRFLNHFILRLGFLDGKKGLTICKLSAYGVKQRYVELEKLYQKE